MRIGLMVTGAKRQPPAPSDVKGKARDRGATADTPRSYSWATAWIVVKRVWGNSGEHDLSLLAAGVAFYAFLSFVPLLAALVMAYGLVADPSRVPDHMRLVIDLVPADAARLIYDQLTQLTHGASERKGLGLIVAMIVSIYGASRAAGAMITSLNIIYEERDRRSYVRWLIVSVALVGGAVLVAMVGLVAASMLGFASGWAATLGPFATAAVQLLTWLLAAALCVLTLGGIYRFAPNRADARWEWLSLGAVFATMLWLLATIGFGIYAARFGDYDATYGSLGAVVVLLMWLYLSAYAVLLGALINAEAERQTARDTTTGPERPMGERGAMMADTSAALE
ncbi:YihY/virulence factor BrkB family protein [Sphingopyxis sp.]|uniref:YihY/virulence factor BrkB family protein n=1 Tax=Sphingopyxis sp. TaxID=1908224 RepID=UPI0025E7C4D0|nr:YihY/virulence factor BrkB family protein [Sphingopyxis sp.]